MNTTKSMFFSPQITVAVMLSLWLVVQMSHALAFFCFARRLNGSQWNLGRWSLPPADKLFTFWAKSYKEQGIRIGQKILIDVKPMLPRIKWRHRYHSTFGTYWRVCYIHAVAEASYDYVQSVALQLLFVFIFRFCYSFGLDKLCCSSKCVISDELKQQTAVKSVMC